MDVGKNITLALYLTLGAGAVFLLVKIATPPVPEPNSTVQDEDSTVGTTSRDAASVLRTQVLRLERELAAQTQENARLQALLRENPAELETRLPANDGPRRGTTRRSNDATADEQLAALIAELQRGPVQKADPAANKPDAAESDPADVALEFIALLEKQHQAEIDRMRADIRRGDDAMAQFREEMEQEIVEMLEAEQAFHLATTEAVISAGAAAVPGLERLLAHVRPEIREWAAYVLGRLGPLARDAVPDLLRLAADSNEAVRTAAAEAIEAIEREGR